MPPTPSKPAPAARAQESRRPQPRRSATARSGPAPVEQVRAPRLPTARALVGAVVVVLAFVIVYPTLHAYLKERAALTSAQQQLAAAQTQNTDLTDELGRWNDKAYVISQARSRLSFVMPGERGYRVVDPGSVSDAPQASDGPAGAITAGSGQPWYDDVWGSVTIAGDSAAG